MIWNKCKHKYGKVEDGYQYCIHCGEARTADCPHDWKLVDHQKQQCTKCGYIEMIPAVECQHKWKIEGNYDIENILNKGYIGKSYYLRCEICGEHKVNNCTIHDRR